MSAPAGFTSITAAKIQNGSGKLLSSGRVSFFPVNSAGRGISATAGGGGLITQTAVVFLVVNGAITTDIFGAAPVVADTTLTTPANIAYRVSVTDSTGTEVQGPGYGTVQPSGPTWSLDTYSPVQPLLVTTTVITVGGASGRPTSMVVADSVTGAHYAVLFIAGAQSSARIGPAGTVTPTATFIDTVTGNHFTLSFVNGAETLTAVSSGVSGIAGFPMADAVTGANYTLQVTNGQLTSIPA
jgi:hypothetical protein